MVKLHVKFYQNLNSSWDSIDDDVSSDASGKDPTKRILII